MEPACICVCLHFWKLCCAPLHWFIAMLCTIDLALCTANLCCAQWCIRVFKWESVHKQLDDGAQCSSGALHRSHKPKQTQTRQMYYLPAMRSIIRTPILLLPFCGLNLYILQIEKKKVCKNEPSPRAPERYDASNTKNAGHSMGKSGHRQILSNGVSGHSVDLSRLHGGHCFEIFTLAK